MILQSELAVRALELHLGYGASHTQTPRSNRVLRSSSESTFLVFHSAIRSSSLSSIHSRLARSSSAVGRNVPNAQKCPSGSARDIRAHQNQCLLGEPRFRRPRLGHVGNAHRDPRHRRESACVAAPSTLGLSIPSSWPHRPHHDDVGAEHQLRMPHVLPRFRNREQLDETECRTQPANGAARVVIAKDRENRLHALIAIVVERTRPYPS